MYPTEHDVRHDRTQDHPRPSEPAPRRSLPRQQHNPCVSLESAALNELVAQLVEQRPFNPNLTKIRRLGETTLYTYK
jgi:hypothetical protein